MSGNPTSELTKQNGNGRGWWLASLTGELHRSIYGSTQMRLEMLSVLIFAAFALIVAALTTDMVLLREGKIILPFIQVGVPLVEFYVVAPALIALLHLNLLGRFILLARDIYNCSDGESSGHVSNKARSDDKAPEVCGVLGMVKIMFFPTDQKRLMSAMRKAVPATPLSSITFFILVMAPLIVLLVLQTRFLAYQDEWITLFHQIMVTVDLFFQFLFMLSFSRLWGGGKIFLRTPRYLIVSVLIAIPAFYAWAVALVPDSDIENKVEGDWQQSIAGCFFPDWWKKYEGVLFPCDFLEGERFINIQSEIITFRDVPSGFVGDLMELLCERIGVLDLSGRRLNYANFSDSTFVCVEMDGTQLNNSKLVKAKLGTANLLRASLSGADLGGADLRWADLRWADLRKADLRKADLRGTDLSWADLREADLWRADLRKAVLWKAAMWKTGQREAGQSWVNLSEADLRGADLRGADLWGADLRWADLSEADLRWADLSGADLSEAVLGRARLSEANLRWADLSGTFLVFADLSEADLSEANLRWADLSGADLSGVKLHRTNLSQAEVYGAILHEAKLSGTILEGAKLYGANFSGSTLRDTSLDKANGGKPERWDIIFDKIKRVMGEADYEDSKINERLAKIEQDATSTQGYVLPTGVDHCTKYVKLKRLRAPVECQKPKEENK